jgi:hypothetical protein
VSEGPIYSAAMSPLLRPVQLLLPMFAGWVNRRQLDRCGRWLFAWQTAFDPRPRCEMLRRIPHCSRARGYSRHSIAAAFAQFEFVRGTIPQIPKGRVPEPVNLPWKGIASARDFTIPQPLSPRAKSSRIQQPVAAARRRHWRTSRPRHSVPATRRDAQLLSSRSGLIRFDPIAGQYGIADCGRSSSMLLDVWDLVSIGIPGGNPRAYKRRARMGRGINGRLTKIHSESVENLLAD